MQDSHVIPESKPAMPAAAGLSAKSTDQTAALPVHDSEYRLKRLEILLEVSRKIAGIDSIDEVLETILSITTRETRADRGTLFINDERTQELFSRVAEGTSSREIRMPNGQGIAGAVFQSGTGMIIADAYQNELFNPAVDEQTGYETKTIVCAPIRNVQNKVIGAIQSLNKTSGVFELEDLELLEAMAMQASIALESTQRIERLKRLREREMEFLDIVADITSEIELSTLLAKVMGEVSRMLNAERATLFLNDEKTSELWAEATSGGERVQIRFPNDQGIAGTVFTSGQSVDIPHAYADLRFNPNFDRQTGFFTRSILCAPVVNKDGKNIGVTQVLNKRGGAFTAADERRLRAFTAQVSIALENAELFEDVQNMKNYNESMLESMSNGVVTFDEDGRVHTCNRACLKILQLELHDVIGQQAVTVFEPISDLLAGKIQRANEATESELLMDADIMIGGQTKSVNVTIQPLVSTESRKLGTMIVIEDISSEKRMKSTMSRYMDPGIAEKLLEGGVDVLSGKAMTNTVLFSDIRSFTTLTEQWGAPGTVSFLNEYFTIMVDCIQKEGGMLDKFIGDAIMAAFGLPLPGEDDEDRAVRAAISMIRELQTWNIERQKNDELAIDMGIGLATDRIVSGNIGSPKRMDYTLIGDGVNLAARLESACKQYGARILISENTFRKLRGTYRIRDIDKVLVKGKNEPTQIYEVLDYYDEASFPNLMEVVNHFNSGIAHFRAQRWDHAIRAFTEANRINRNDKVTSLYLARAQMMKSNPPGPDWDGVWTMESK